MEMSGAKILVETLIEQGVETVFGYPGGQVLNIYDELYLYSDKINHVLTAHEQGAAHAAEGYARSTGKVGVCIATSGPGATNLITGIADAYLDSVPMVAITGNVPCFLLGRDSFQEVDAVGITLSITKHNFMVKDVNELADTIRKAFKIAKSGRPGPVHIDIPKDVQINKAFFESLSPVEKDEMPKASDNTIQKAVQLIKEAKRPYIYCGGGVTAADAQEEVKALAQKIDAPIGFSIMGLANAPHDFEYALGMVGMHGSYPATKAKDESDLIIAVGVRFSDRATGDKSKYALNKKIIHIDVDSAELHKNITADLAIKSDVKYALTKIIENVDEKKHEDWHNHIEKLKGYNELHSAKQIGELTPFEIIAAVNERTNAKTPIATDVGQHQMWVAQHYKFSNPRTFITSGGLGTMGFGMGAAIGSCIATGERTVLFTGDGSFGMNLNELATAVSQNLPLVIIVMNNGVLGMVRQWQKMFYNEHYSSTTLKRKTDFVAIAKGFAADAYSVTNLEELNNHLDTAFKTNGTVLLDCHINCDERVLPMIPPGGSVNDLIIK